MTSLAKISFGTFPHSKVSFYFSEISFLVLLVFQHYNLGYSEPHFASSFCIKKSGSYTSNSLYRSNLSLVFSNLTFEASLKGFSNFTAGEGIDKVYSLYYCRGDLKLADCQACIQTAISRIVFECPNEKEAIIFFEECTFRYTNRSIFSLEEEDPNDWSYSQSMVSNKDQFNDVLTAAISSPINQAAFNSSNNGFATGITTNSSSNQTVYSLAQCTPDILGTPCHKCLLAALGNLLDEGKTRMSLFMPSCQVMYSLSPFFSVENATSISPINPGVHSAPDSPSSKVSGKSQKNGKLYIGVGIAGALGLLFIIFGLWFWMRRRASEKKSLNDIEGLSPKFQHNVHSTFTYEELSVATDNFSSANLIGQGGFGYVHKGVLPNGKKIAVKQLKTGSLQGDREFQAEVETISRVHHRHLVSLVGYCITGNQRILVYEFIPNKTLEFHLHDKIPLSWETRLKIALGAAKGLAYLHEDCHPKIIHRDIKAANILIDDDFEAKVADFGLAKFSLDTDTHVTTRVMGTFGYLAPDYAASGKLTEKSDVFSFGVLLLEIITGRKPVDRFRPYIEGSMVEWARPLLRQALEGGNNTDLVDPRLEDYNPFEMSQMIACADACIRASARERPRMNQVVQTLEGNMSADDLLKEECTQDNRMLQGSSDYNSNVQNSEDLRKSGKVGLPSQEHSNGEFSESTSEYGVNVSSSSNENQHKARELYGR